MVVVICVVRRFCTPVILGKNGNNNPGKYSTEIISLDQPPVQGPDLPFKVRDHSMVLVNPTTIYLIGGFQNCQCLTKLG